MIVLTTFDDDGLVRQALSAGAAGFMLKDSTPHDLVHAMRSVIEGGLVIDPRVARAALTPARADSAEDEPGPLAVLTRTELAVGAEVARGATNSEIAAALVIAEGTVKNHISSLLRKLGQRDRTALALLLHRYLGVPGERAHYQGPAGGSLSPPTPPRSGRVVRRKACCWSPEPPTCAMRPDLTLAHV